MKLNRLLDLPYIRIEDLGDKPWKFIMMDRPIPAVAATITFNVMGSTFPFITGFSNSGRDIDSPEKFIDFCTENLLDIESHIFDFIYFYHLKLQSVKEGISYEEGEKLKFKSLSWIEKSEVLGLSNYLQDRNLVELYELIAVAKKRYTKFHFEDNK